MSLEKTVLIATQKPFSEEARDAAVKIMEDEGLNVRLLEGYTSQQELIDASDGVRALIVRSDYIDQVVIDGFPELELIVRAGAGVNTIDVNYAEQRNIVVEPTPGQNSNAAAELAVQMMLRSIRPLNGKKGNELKGKKLGIHGFGHIGQIVARLGIAHGMEVSVYDKFLDERKAKEYGVTTVNSPEDLYSGRDIVSIHIPAIEGETIRSIGYNLLNLMPAKGIVINTARAELIDEEGLVKILRERSQFKYATDVAPTDEIKAILDEEFKDRTIITPKKQGAETDEANYNAAVAAAQLCCDYLNRGLTPHAVNNPLPNGMKDYALLAQALGKFNESIGGVPSRIEIICHGDLAKFQEHFGPYVLKGLFEKDLGRELTPTEALSVAKEKGIEILYRNPDPRTLSNLSLDIIYFDQDGNTYEISGRIDGSELQITRVGKFKQIIPITPLEYVLTEYAEEAGMADRIGDVFTKSGYNKANGGFRQNDLRDRAMVFFQVEPVRERVKGVKAVVEDIKKIPGVLNSYYVDMRN
jgi:D-3-phosphoglycerate dehydrogenase